MWPVGWEALKQWGDDDVRIEPLTGGAGVNGMQPCGSRLEEAHGGASIGSAACGGCSEVDRLDVRLALDATVVLGDSNRTLSSA